MTPQYPAYKDSGLDWLGGIPAHWETIKAKWVFASFSQKNCPDEQLLSATQEFGVVPRDMLEDRVMMPTGELVHFKLVEPGDFVISLRSFQGGIEYSNYRGLVSPAYTVLKNKRPIDKTYFKYLMKSFPFVSELQTSITGIRDGKNINYKDFAEIYLPVPPVQEQVRIAKFIEEKTAVINKFITHKQRLIDLLQEQKQVVVNTAVTQGLDPHVPRKPSGIEWLGDIPAHWRIQKIGYIAEVGNGSTPSRSNMQYWQNGTYPWLNSSSVNQSVITEADQYVTTTALDECHLPIVKPNSILVAITGQGKTRGTAALLTFEATINQHMAYITPLAKVLAPEYLHTFLQGSYTYLRFISDGQGGTKGALTCSDIKQFKVPIPPLSEQEAIVQKVKQSLRKIDATIERARREIELIEEYRTTLIATAVTGKINVATNQPPAVRGTGRQDHS
jgi:type I restriction enzyme, S subunit